jgi:hypothetical protein
MAKSVNVQDILEDIDFEIAQGVILQDGLGQGVEAVKQYQNNVRVDTFEKLKLTDPYREILSRQFQLNDMLITLSQEMAKTIQSMQHGLKNLNQVPIRATQEAGPAKTWRPNGTATGPSDVDTWVSEIDDPPLSTEEIENVMQPEAIHVDLQMRTINIPIIGWLATRLRIFLHRPALFYTQIFSHKQAPVNRAFGDWILRLNDLIQIQNEQVGALNAYVAELDARIQKLEGTPTGDAENLK